MLERAMLRLREDQRIPHEIRIIGTPAIVAEVHRELLSDAGAIRFSSLCAGLGIARDDILFNQRTVHTVNIEERDCAARADRLLDLLRRLCHSDESCFTVVVAEDAGLPGYLMHACLQVVARTADRLLIDFSPETGARSVKPFPANCPHLEVPLLLWPANEPVPGSYADAVRVRRRERQRVARPDVLRLDRRRRTVSVGETSRTLPAMQFFWLYYLASTPGEQFPLREVTAGFSTSTRHSTFTQRLSNGRTRTFPDDLRRVFVQLLPYAGDKFEEVYRRACGPSPGLPSTISKINATLRQALGRGASPYLIEGGRGAGGYRITLPASSIELVGAEVKRT
jgi:hypothetical protein